MYAGVPLNNVMYDLKQKDDGSFCANEWFSVKPQLKNINPLVNLPYVMDGDVVVSQSNACMVYLGRKLGLWGKTLEEQCECEQLLCELMDLRDAMTHYAYGSTGEEGAQKLFKNVQGKNGILQKLELWLELKAKKNTEGITNLNENTQGNGAFLVGNSATAPDFHLYELLVQYTALAKVYNLPAFLGSFPHLLFYMNAFEALPGNARYLATLGAPNTIPFNNKMAGFGSSASNGAWQQGEKDEFSKLTGIY
jgi:glutathione S-transferase